MPARFHLVATAFIRSTGGRISVLFAVDRDHEPLHDGEPVLLVEHRPGSGAADLVVEPAEALPSTAEAAVRATQVAAAIIELIEGAFDRAGNFDGQQLLGRLIEFDELRHAFGE